jgi:hypothetical protein
LEFFVYSPSLNERNDNDSVKAKYKRKLHKCRFILNKDKNSRVIDTISFH